MRSTARHVCPICGRDAPRFLEGEKKNATFPFCSPSCKLVDLGRWLDGGYVIPDPEAQPVDEPCTSNADEGDRE